LTTSPTKTKLLLEFEQQERDDMDLIESGMSAVMDGMRDPPPLPVTEPKWYHVLSMATMDRTWLDKGYKIFSELLDPRFDRSHYRVRMTNQDDVLEYCFDVENMHAATIEQLKTTTLLMENRLPPESLVTFFSYWRDPVIETSVIDTLEVRNYWPTPRDKSYQLGVVLHPPASITGHVSSASTPVRPKWWHILTLSSQNTHALSMARDAFLRLIDPDCDRSKFRMRDVTTSSKAYHMDVFDLNESIMEELKNTALLLIASFDPDPAVHIAVHLHAYWRAPDGRTSAILPVKDNTWPVPLNKTSMLGVSVDDEKVLSVSYKTTPPQPKWTVGSDKDMEEIMVASFKEDALINFMGWKLPDWAAKEKADPFSVHLCGCEWRLADYKAMPCGHSAVCQDDYAHYNMPPVNASRCPKCFQPIESLERIIAPVTRIAPPVPYNKADMLDVLAEPDDMDLEMWSGDDDDNDMDVNFDDYEDDTNEKE